MRSFFSLSSREQLIFYRNVRDYLGTAIGEETEADKQLTAREEALAALQRVAEHHGLKEGDAPTTTQHHATPDDVTKGWSTTRVARAWGRYRFAQQAFRDERVPESPAARSLRRATSGKARRHQMPWPGLRQWWEQEPASTTQKDYDDYVRKYNNAVLGGQEAGPPLIQASAARAGVGLGWKAILQVLRGDSDAEKLLHEREQERRAQADPNSLGLVSGPTVALILGRSEVEVNALRRAGDLPTPVIKMGSYRGWVVGDLEAYRDGRPVPVRQPNEIRRLVMDTGEMAERMGYKTKECVVAARYYGNSFVPPPDGRIGSALYWVRENAEAWFAANPRRSRRSTHPDKARARAQYQGE